MEAALRLLRQQLNQLSADGFLTAIAPAGDFSKARHEGTAFFVALTLNSLNYQPQAELEDVRQALRQTLRSARKSTGSWNYWLPNTAAAGQRPLPDDLDTTACVLAACAKSQETLSGAWVADAVRLLTLREVQPGGPYRTWLVPSDAPEVWQDVDPVVNANIGRLLAALEASPEPLIKYLDEVVRDRSRVSPYYPDRLLFRYFLAPWYKGLEYLSLVAECRDALPIALETRGVQTLAIALATASCLPEIENSLLQNAETELAKRCLELAIVAETTCIDAIHGEVKDHAGSTAFTLAICHEALARAQERTKVRAASDDLEQKINQRAQLLLAELPATLAGEATATLITMLAADRSHNLTRLPLTIAQIAYPPLAVDDSNLDILVAHLFGWLAYTIYDDVVDGDTKADQLWLANVFQRLSTRLFLETFPGQSGWKNYCQQTFARMDEMNLVEQKSWCLVDGQLPRPLPTPDLAYLTERSRGVLLAPVALVRQATAYPLDHPLIVALEQFLLHLVAVRQLCDDAHDWQDDLAKGRLNSASALLFADSEVATSNLDDQQRHFWTDTIDLLTTKVREHGECARAAAQSFPAESSLVVEKLLQPLEASMEKAVRERNFAQQFMTAYQRGQPVIE